MPGIFISYRRDDSGGYAGRLRDGLLQRYGEDFIFLDTANKMPPGVDYTHFVIQTVESSDVLLAIIGREWLSITDKDGRRRIDDPKDLLRVEITAALDKKLLVIPVTVDGAEIPKVEDLPDPLKPLAGNQQWQMRNNGWDEDLKKLCSWLDGLKPDGAPKEPLRDGYHPFALCDRADQWNYLQILADREDHMVILLPGELNQAHSLFLQRVRQCLATIPRRIILTVNWESYPQSRKEFIEAIGAVFRCNSEANLVEELRRKLVDQNVYLLHMPVFQEDRPALIDYYTEWLPDLLRKVDPGRVRDDRIRSLKCIQPVGWYETSWLKSAASNFFKSRTSSSVWIHNSLSKKEYVALMKEINQQRDEWLSIFNLTELSNIELRDVELWAQAIGKSDPQSFAKRVTFGARSTAEILQRITD